MRSFSPGSWLLMLVLSLLLSLVTGLGLIWLSIERTDLAFSIRQMHTQLEEKTILRSKLELERDRLLAPYILRPKALRLGMHEARPGQIRKLQASPAQNASDQSEALRTQSLKSASEPNSIKISSSPDTASVSQKN